MTHYIYGLYNRKGACLYVGSSIRPRQRMQSHCHPKSPFRSKVFCGMVLRSVEWAEPARVIETRVIEAYKRRGQCRYNRGIGHGNVTGGWERHFSPYLSTINHEKAEQELKERAHNA